MQIFILLQWQWFNIIEWLLNFIIIVSPRVRSFALLWSIYAYIRYCLLGNWGESVRHMHISCFFGQWVHMGFAEEKWLLSWELRLTNRSARNLDELKSCRTEGTRWIRDPTSITHQILKWTTNMVVKLERLQTQGNNKW